MKATNRRNKRVYRRFLKDRTLIWGVAFLCLSSVALFCDASYWNCRLDSESIKRASTRVLTSSDERLNALDDSASIRTRSELDERLVNSALEYRGACYAPESKTDRVIADGLARWGVDRTTLERLGYETDFASAFEDAEHSRGDGDFILVSDSRAARDAIDVLEDWDDDSSDLDAALDFLRELDDVESNGENDSGDLILWTFNAEKGNPIDYAGFVSIDDFDPGAVIRVARRASDASARLFFLTTLGGLFFSRRKSVLDDALGVNFATRELDAFFARCNLVGRSVFLALRDFCFLLCASGWFASLSRRRLWILSFLPSTDSLLILANIRLNN